MTKLALTESELEDIAEALDSPDVMEKFKVKLLVLRMHHEKVDHGVIARAVGRHPDTITSCLKEFAGGGLSASLEDRAYKPSSALHPFMACLRCSFTVAPPPTAKHAVARIAALARVTRLRRASAAFDETTRHALSQDRFDPRQIRFTAPI